jgi:hypothetical protein
VLTTSTRPADSDPARDKLCTLLATKVLYKRLHQARVFLVHVLAVIGGGLWLELVWPTLLPESMRVSIPALWRAGCILALIAVILEGTWYRRQVRRLTEYQETQREEPDGT